VNGSRATLHQGEALGGVEVQLIMADSAYLQRGADVKARECRGQTALIFAAAPGGNRWCWEW
jgi:hypothetical protein